MEPVTQSLAQSKAGLNRAPPNASTGALGKFGTFWMPKSNEEISRRTGADHGRQLDAKDKFSKDKLARQKSNPQTHFRDLIRQKEAPRTSKSALPPEQSGVRLNKQVDPKAVRQQQLPQHLPRPAAKHALPPATVLTKTLAPERAAATDKPPVQTSSKKDVQESLKQIREQRERDMDHDQEHDRENERDHGAGNAKREQAPQVQDDLQETSKPAMNSSSKPAPKTQSLGSPDVEARSGGIEVNTSSELSSSIPAERFLRSDDKSQRDSRHVFTHVRKRIGGYMDGESRMARIAIDLPGGGRLGIKMRFVGNQLEVIFATEDMALRAALLEDWRRLAREMSDGESRLLPPAFAQENYEGIVRGEWNEAA